MDTCDSLTVDSTACGWWLYQTEGAVTTVTCSQTCGLETERETEEHSKRC